MGYKISWIGFEAADKADCLQRLGMTDTGEDDSDNETRFSLAELPGGWLILYANDFEYASDARLAELSQGTRLIGCQVHEGVMYARVASFEDGVKLWSVVHDAQEDSRHIAVTGDVPAGFKALHQKLLRQQDEEDAGEAEVDHIFDAPVALAYDIAGYRYDMWVVEGDPPVFTALDAPAEVKTSWWSRLFGKRG